MRKRQFLRAGTAGALLILSFVVLSVSDIVPELIFKNNSAKSETAVSAEELNIVTRELKAGVKDSFFPDSVKPEPVAEAGETAAMSSIVEPVEPAEPEKAVEPGKKAEQEKAVEPVLTGLNEEALIEPSGGISETFEKENMPAGLLASDEQQDSAASDTSYQENSANPYVKYPAADRPLGGQTFLTSSETENELSEEIPEGLSTEEEQAYYASLPYRIKMGEVLPYFVQNGKSIITLDENNQEQHIDSSTVEFLSVYYQGTQDPSVAYIQQHLMDLGFMESAEPTEYYGSITMAAVKLFQRQNGLKQDGIMGRESLGMLINPDAQRYLLKPEMEGEDISRVQTRLYELGYLSSRELITGYYGSQTEAAVKAMQTANSLDADGKIGEITFELLYSGDVKANVLSFGDKSDIVLECQERLKELGYLTTKPDGLYGNDTLAAVKLFQSRNDLVVDGYLGPTTREVLLSSDANTNGLMIGSEGDTVKRVQELLIKYGYLGSGKNTGYFGTQTDSAVRAFQRDNGLTVDGEVGSKTMAKLTGGSASGASGASSSGYKVSDDSSVEDSINALINVAKSKLGCSYVYGGKGPNTFDCSGFVYWCLNQIGVKQSYITSNGWRNVGKYRKITDYSSLKAGDIIVVSGHVGIIAEDRTVIDASSSKGKIMHRKLSSWWADRFICGWRIFY